MNFIKINEGDDLLTLVNTSQLCLFLIPAMPGIPEWYVITGFVLSDGRIVRQGDLSLSGHHKDDVAYYQVVGELPPVPTI